MSKPRDEMTVSDYVANLHTVRHRLANRAGNALFVPFVCGISRLRTVGLHHVAELPPPWIVVFNHVSMADGPVSRCALPPSIRRRSFGVAAADTMFRPGLRILTVSIGNSLPFDRTNLDPEFVYSVTGLIRDGWSCYIAPEGTRYPPGSGGRFTGTAALLSKATGAPIVMQHLEGAGSVLPKGHLLPRPGKITVTYGEPLYPEPDETRRQLEDRLNVEYTKLARSTGCLVETQDNHVDSSPWRSAWREYLLGRQGGA